MHYAGEGFPSRWLTQRRELRRDDEHVLLADKLAARVGWPCAGFARLLARRKAVGGILVGPDVDPLVQRAEFGVAAERQRREFQPPLDPLGPALDDGRRRSGEHRVAADLIE